MSIFILKLLNKGGEIRCFVLEGPSGHVNNTKNMLNFTLTFYKYVFDFEPNMIFTQLGTFGVKLS
jgi:hypothetical protein